MPLKGLRPGDIAALGLALLLFAASIFAVYGTPSGGAAVNIEGEGGSWVYPLDADASSAVSGPLGVTTVRVKNGAVSVIESPCKNQTCVMAGAVSGRGQWIACLPNRVLITIDSGGGKDGGQINPQKPADEAIDAGTW